MSTLAMASSSFKLASVTTPHGHYSRQCHRITIPSTASDSPQQQPNMPRRNILFNKCEMGKLLGPPRRCGSFMTCSSEAIMTGARDHVQWWMTDPKAQVQGDRESSAERPSSQSASPPPSPLWMSMLFPTLDIFLPLITAVNDGIIGFQVVEKGCDSLIDGSTDLDENDDGFVLPEGRNEGCSGMILW